MEKPANSGVASQLNQSGWRGASQVNNPTVGIPPLEGCIN